MPLDALDKIGSFFEFAGFFVMAVSIAPLFPFLYVVLRWRSDRAGAGTYGAVLYFQSAALLVTIGAAANLLYGWFSTTPIDEFMNRVSWGAFVGGAIFFALNALIARLARPGPDLLASRRIFGGFLMVMAGGIAFFALAMLFVTIFAEPDKKIEDSAELRIDTIKLWTSWTACFLVTYLATTRAMLRGV